MAEIVPSEIGYSGSLDRLPPVLDIANRFDGQLTFKMGKTYWESPLFSFSAFRVSIAVSLSGRASVRRFFVESVSRMLFVTKSMYPNASSEGCRNEGLCERRAQSSAVSTSGSFRPR
jgi:hypothetical protein